MAFTPQQFAKSKTQQSKPVSQNQYPNSVQSSIIPSYQDHILESKVMKASGLQKCAFVKIMKADVL